MLIRAWQAAERLLAITSGNGVLMKPDREVIPDAKNKTIAGSVAPTPAVYRLEWKFAWRHPDGGERVHIRSVETSAEALATDAKALACEAFGREFRVSLMNGDCVVARVYAHVAEIENWIAMDGGVPQATMPTTWAADEQRGRVRLAIYAEILDALGRAAAQRIATRRSAREIAGRVRAAFDLR